ncbi:hypothetical protein AQUCO_00100831v1 [Aquilegia coerulea]|uniref:Uncharacterized protein n=1 Tax=Aquilegia coerulea TaxID=218851 RepID=A0A2G5FCD7_AQUCA|nr:hypothetical protein AQUCO_00100831v1 [Aquilegia coerulea]
MESSEGGINGVEDTSDPSRNRNKRWVFGRKLRKVKKVVVSPFRKIQKKNTFSSSSSSQPVVVGKNSCFLSYLCFKPSHTLDSTVSSPISDPNNPKFSSDLLRVMIESNDFYSKECNTHIDISDTE